jgi:hypothetical protein
MHFQPKNYFFAHTHSNIRTKKVSTKSHFHPRQRGRQLQYPVFTPKGKKALKLRGGR